MCVCVCVSVKYTYVWFYFLVYFEGKYLFIIDSPDTFIHTLEIVLNFIHTT